MINLNAWSLLCIVINLLILFIAMRGILFKPIQDIIAKRQEEANAQLAEADRQKNLAEELKMKYEESLAGIEKEKKKVLADARSKADGEYKRIIKDAKRAAVQMKDAAKAEAENQKSQILKSAEKEIADLVVDAAAKMVGNSSGFDEDRALYNKFLDKAGDES